MAISVANQARTLVSRWVCGQCGQ